MQASSTQGSRRGQLIPVMGVILIIFAFMAMSYMFHSQTVTSVTGLAIYGEKARQLALAAAEEAGFELSIKFDDTRDQFAGQGEWKQQLVDLLKDQLDGTAVELDKADISDLIPETLGLIGNVHNAELLQARVKFHGFHRLNYSNTDAYDNAESYYRNALFNDESDSEDAGKVLPVEDWVGFATLQMRVAVRGVERQVQVTHDIKLVDTTPWAREFNFFNWMPLLQEQEAAGLGFTSFNEGGKFILWPNNVARTMIRGPYRIITEGNSTGDGGEDRSGSDRQNMSYPRADSDWRGWAAVPGLRALLYNPIAWPWGDNIRPKNDGTIFPMGLRIPTIAFVTILTSDHSFDCSTQQYFVASTAVGNQTFSLWGQPGNASVPMPPDAEGNPADNGWSMFRGMKMKMGDSSVTPQGVYDTANNIGGGSNGDAVLPEGLGIWGIYKLAEFKNLAMPALCLYFVWPPPCLCVDGFMIRCIPTPGCLGLGIMTLTTPADLESSGVQSALSSGDFSIAPYGLYFMEKESINGWVAALGVVIQFAASYAAGSTLGSGGGGGSGFLGGTAFWNTGSGFTMSGLGTFMSFMGTAAKSSLWHTGGMSMMSAFTGGEGLPTASEIASAVPEGLYPPKFHPPLRGATRLHVSLEDALNAEGDLLTLDGVVAVETVDVNGAQQDFQYRGRGMLYTVTTGDDNNKNPFLGDITPQDPGQDWMTFAHFVGREPQPDGGDCQVLVNSNKLQMTLYAQEGVQVDSGQSSIYGNLVAGVPNKHKIATDAELHVFYNYKRLANQAQGGSDPGQWTNGTWKHVSVSPKVSGYYDHFR